MSNWPLQRDMLSFYGDPRQSGWLHINTIDITCPWPLWMGSIQISHIIIHKKCAESLIIVLNNIWDSVGHDLTKIKTLRYDQYSGSYNLRLIRGSYTTLSCHAFAAAIDWDAPENLQHNRQHLFTDDSLLVVKFKEEGWIWGGDWAGDSIDAMHVQAARVHE